MYYLIDIENEEVVGQGATKALAIANFSKNYDISEYDKTKLVLATKIKDVKVAVAVVEV